MLGDEGHFLQHRPQSGLCGVSDEVYRLQRNLRHPKLLSWKTQEQTLTPTRCIYEITSHPLGFCLHRSSIVPLSPLVTPAIGSSSQVLLLNVFKSTFICEELLTADRHELVLFISYIKQECEKSHGHIRHGFRYPALMNNLK